jgi:hypothetical protein
LETSPWQIVLRPYLEKNPSQKKAGGVTQVVDRLLSKCEALSSNSSTTKKKKKKKIKRKKSLDRLKNKIKIERVLNQIPKL